MDSTTGRPTAQNDSPEQLLDVFKAAALSVTRLYKSSVAAESRARSEGYQDCIDDLLAFLERESTSLDDASTVRLRKWAADRREGRDGAHNESDEEPEKRESTPAPDSTTQPSRLQPTLEVKRDSPAPVDIVPARDETPHFIVPSQENFTFQSDYQYPNIATLDLSDARPHVGVNHHPSRAAKSRLNGGSNRSGPRSSNSLGRGAGSKRRMDFDDFFGNCFGGKDPFGNNGKRSRHN
jgi:hypothetical protein